MKPGWFSGLAAGGLMVLVGMVATRGLSAQARPAGAPSRVGVVDVVQVFNEFQKQRDLTEEMNTLRVQLEEENKQRRQRIDASQAELDRLSRDDPTFTTRSHDLLKLQIDYKNWLDLKQADMTREIGLWSIAIYKDIRKTIEQIAARDGFELVIYKGQFEEVSLDPEQVKEQIRSLQVLYASPTADLTAAVTEKLNTDYRAQPRVKMIYSP